MKNVIAMVVCVVCVIACNDAISNRVQGYVDAGPQPRDRDAHIAEMGTGGVRETGGAGGATIGDDGGPSEAGSKEASAAGMQGAGGEAVKGDGGPIEVSAGGAHGSGGASPIDAGPTWVRLPCGTDHFARVSYPRGDLSRVSVYSTDDRTTRLPDYFMSSDAGVLQIDCEIGDSGIIMSAVWILGIG